MKDYSSLDKVLPRLKSDYKAGELPDTGLAKDPMEQFTKWFEKALAAGVPAVNVMTLGTCDKHGNPSARNVLLKGFNKEGFSFYTSYTSQKGRELAVNPHASLVFFWALLEKQVSVTGIVKKLSAGESDAYFNSRPVNSRIAALASDQSQPIESRAALEMKFSQTQKKYANADIPRPEDWGGYLLEPQTVEFWQGRENRLNDRIRYERVSKVWKIQRIQP